MGGRWLIAGVLILSVGFSSYPAAANSGGELRCQDTYCEGKPQPPAPVDNRPFPLTSETVGDPLTNPATQELLRDYPDFFALPPGMFDGLDLARLPMNMRRMTYSVPCENELIKQLMLQCGGPGLLMTMTIFGVGFSKDGKIQLVPIPAPTPEPPKDDDKWTRLKKRATAFWAVIATVAGAGYVVYDQCIASESEAACRKMIDWYTYGERSINKEIRSIAHDEALQMTLANQMTDRARRGYKTILIRNGSKTVFVTQPGAEESPGRWAPYHWDVEMDVAPEWSKVQGRLYVPLRFVTEAAGFVVSNPRKWCEGKLAPEEKSACSVLPTISTPEGASNRVTIHFPLEQTFYIVNGKQEHMVNPDGSHGGQTYLHSPSNRTMVPVRFALETFGWDVQWHKECECATLSMKVR